MTIIMGDFNAQIGNEKLQEAVRGTKMEICLVSSPYEIILLLEALSSLINLYIWEHGNLQTEIERAKLTMHLSTRDIPLQLWTSEVSEDQIVIRTIS